MHSRGKWFLESLPCSSLNWLGPKNGKKLLASMLTLAWGARAVRGTSTTPSTLQKPSSGITPLARRVCDPSTQVAPGGVGPGHAARLHCWQLFFRGWFEGGDLVGACSSRWAFGHHLNRVAVDILRPRPVPHGTGGDQE